MIYFVDLATSTACHPGWSYFPKTERCYKYYSEKKTWPDARFFCRREAFQLGSDVGDLASIPDQATQDFLVGVPNGRAPIYPSR